MTISSLAKKLVGVNRMVVEKVEIEEFEGEASIIVKARPTKKDACRCGICGRKCGRYDPRKWAAAMESDGYWKQLQSLSGIGFTAS
ncbi:MAG: hypothetical protein J5938_05485 [Clostridia bacterium]|nr:hypothetical protein [Clostridia bacterium]